MALRSVVLNNGAEMPLFGLGTFRLRGKEQLKPVVEAALSAGYRSFDSAAGYGNEEDLASCFQDVLPNYGLKKDDLFITTKLDPRDQGGEKCRQACLKSLKNLQCDSLDMYLIHWPGAKGFKADDPKLPQMRKESWIAMEQLHKEGKCRGIGVSNYTLRHLKELLSFCNIKPAVLQVEYHPHLVQEELLGFCKEHDILLQAYSSLGSQDSSHMLVNDPVIKSIAEKVGKSPVKVLLRWAVQQGIGVIPKSGNINHIRENIDIWNFELSYEDMTALKGLNVDRHYCWDPCDIV